MLQTLSSPAALDALFNPRSVALFGISDKPGSYGLALEQMCRQGGYQGRIFRVNNRLAQIDETVFAQLSELPETPDHVVISVASDRVESAVDQTLAIGARALTVFAECPDPMVRKRLGTKVRRAGAVMCGPNSMGVHNLTDQLRVTPFQVPLDRPAGGIGLIAQSGSILGALVNNAPQLRFSQAVSTGSETATTAADYLTWMVGRSDTICIGLFLETVRDPERFRYALDQAHARGKPVVILKVGRSALGAKMAMSHTGALVGNDAVFRAMVRRYGAHLVDTVDEMAALLAAFSQNRTPQGTQLASIHDSGGERELIADLAEAAGLNFATLGAEQVQAMETVLEPGIAAENPLDAWSTGHDAENSFSQAAQIMMSDPNVGVGFYVLNWRDDYPLHEMHERALVVAAKATNKPLFAVSNYALSDHKALATRLADHGIPLIGGLQNALLAAKAILTPPPVLDKPDTDAFAALGADWRNSLSQLDWVSEADGYALFESFGVSVPKHGRARSADDAVALAEGIDGPVILKTAKPGLAHKSEVGGVIAHLTDSHDVAAAYEDLAKRLHEEVLVSEMLPAGSEWALGAVIDPDFGPAVRIAPGGILVELMPDQAVLLAPFSAAEARQAILSLSASKTLQGYRGQAPKALDKLAELASALSVLAWTLQDCIAEVEINPVIVGETDACAADALIRKTAP